MRKKSLSSQVATELLKKLRDESIPVELFLVTKRRSEIRFSGFVSDLTWDEGITVSQTKPAAGTFVHFPLTHDCEFFDGTPEAGDLSSSFGHGEAAFIVFASATEESLVLFFNPSPVN